MKKQLLLFVTILLFKNYVVFGMANKVITFDLLPQHVTETLGSFIKRPGRDTFRCVNKACNAGMYSQDELNIMCINAYKNGQKNEVARLGNYGAFPHPALELTYAVEDGDLKLTK